MPAGKSVSEYNFGQVPELNAAQTRQLYETMNWVGAGENVLLFGASVLGKSHLAAAIVDGVVGQGYRARFFSVGELRQELQKERIRKRIYKTRDLARADIFDYIEVFYNRARRHSHLGGVSPEAFEQASS